MITVWKYPLDRPQGTLHIADSAKVVHVDMQNTAEGKVLCAWIEHDTLHAITDGRKYWVVGTGHEIPDHYAHVGTALDGPFVWHLYVEPR